MRNLNYSWILSLACVSAGTTLSVGAQAQMAMPYGDTFTRATEGTALGMTTFSRPATGAVTAIDYKLWQEPPHDYLPEWPRADFQIINGQLELGALGPADTATAFVNENLDDKPDFTIRFALKAGLVGASGLFLLPRAQGIDIPTNKGWVFFQKDGDTGKFKVYPYAGTARSTTSPRLIPKPPTAVAAEFTQADVHQVLVKVSGNTATLYIDNVNVGTQTALAAADNGTADHVMFGYSASSTGTAACSTLIDNLSVAFETQFPVNTVGSNFGVNMNTIPIEAGDITKLLQAHSSLPSSTTTPVQYARTGARWSAIETTKGIYDFAPMNGALNPLRYIGMNLIVPLAYHNELYENDVPGIQHQNTREAYVKWAGATAHEYRNQGIIWEIWNEPNNDHFWNESADAVDEYMALLNAAVPAIKAADPTSLVVSGGLDVLGGHLGRALPFLKKAVASHLPAKVDGIGLHLYGALVQPDPETPSKSYNNQAPERIIAEVKEARRLLPESYPLLNTEQGVLTSSDPNPMYFVDEETKAQALVRMHLLTHLARLKLNIWYNWRGGDNGRAALIDFSTFAPRLPFHAMKYMLAALDGYSYERRIDVGAGVNQDVYALVFKNGANRKLVLWSTMPGTTWVPIPINIPMPDLTGTYSFPVRNIYGAAFDVDGDNDVDAQDVVRAESGRIHAPATSSPIYIDLGSTWNVLDNVDSGMPDRRWQLELQDGYDTSRIDLITHVHGHPAASAGSLHRPGGMQQDSDWIEYTLPVTPGKYRVLVGRAKAGTMGSYQLSIVDPSRPANVQVPEFATVSLNEAQDPSRVGIDDLGAVDIYTSFPQFRFTMRSAAPNNNLLLDYIELVPAINTFQAEHLAQHNTQVVRRLQDPTVADTFYATGVGDKITYTVPVARAGTYTLKFRYKRRTNRGIYKLDAKDSATATVQCLGYGDQRETGSLSDPFREVVFSKKVVFSTPGNKELTFTVAGTNSTDATGKYYLTFDYLKLEESAAATPVGDCPAFGPSTPLLK